MRVCVCVFVCVLVKPNPEKCHNPPPPGLNDKRNISRIVFFVSASSDTSTVAQSVRVSWTSESRLDDDAGEFAVVGDSSFNSYSFSWPPVTKPILHLSASPPLTKLDEVLRYYFV